MSTYYELTHPQKRIWYIDKINLGKALHNIGGSLNISGGINVEIMKKALNLIIETNDGMRLQFTEVNNQGMQYVVPYEEQEIGFFDFSKNADPEADYRNWVQDVFKQSFDLIDSPMFYFAIYKISEARFGILLKIHHLIADGWSIALIQKQACEFYTQLFRNAEQVLYETSSYLDFIESEEKYLNSKRFMKNKAFWAEKLQNPPSEFLYNGAASIEGQRSRIEVETSLSNQIKDFIHHKKCSLNTFFTAAMMIYLYKTTNETDLMMGTGVFNRTNRGQRRMIGMFTSTMPLRFLLNPKHHAGELIEELDHEIRNCFVNQKYPYDLIVGDLELSKAGYDSLFRMTINYYNMEMDNQLEGMEVTNDEHYNGHQSYSMQLIVKEWAQKNIELDFDYKIQEYSEAEIKTMQQGIIHIARQLTNEELLIEDMELVDDDEAYNRLHCFNATKSYCPQKTVAELFEEQAASDPAKIALEFADQKLTYQELNEKANQLAAHLRGLGVGRQTIVPFLITHAPELVISILAILKAGGTYLPIDPDYPVGRINYLLKDCGSKLLVTNISQDDLEFAGEIINLSQLDLSSYCPQNQASKNELADLAYILYTSGSTGKPKGVMVKHRGLTNYIWWANKMYFKDENEAIALYSSIAFDLTVTSVFTPLISGRKIVIYDQDDAEFVLYKILRENKVTVIKLTPAHLALLKDHDYSASSVKRFIVGGDDLKVSLAKEIKGIEIYNEYGPTETVVGCMIHQFDAEKDTALSVPIGRPADNVGIYILNGDLKVMPVGLPGELYIAGDGVAKGYLNNEALTQEKFIDNPFVAGQKMYKTGDMARYLENGLIEYLGRRDNQVKIRGHRVEIGEIERCLTEIAGVKQAAVVPGESLNAYVVAVEVSEQELKAKLSESLPRYMIPTNFVFIDQLPLTVNGKLDLEALPEPVARETEFAAAITEAETQLVQALMEILGVDQVSMNDNFYQLGGDSIKAIQISAKLNNNGYALKAKDILSYETIKEIAAAVESVEAEAIDQGMVTGDLALTPIMKWFFEQNYTNENHYHQSIVLKLDHFVMSNIKKALTKLVEHHDALRLNYDRARRKLVYNHEIPEVEVAYFDLANHSQKQQDLLVEELGWKLKAELDIEKDLLFKAGVFNLGVNGHLLLLTAHHLVVDGVSWRIILEDLDYLLSVADDQEAKLPLKTHSFSEWSNWLYRYSEKSLELEKQYWSEALASPFTYPVDFDTGPDTVGKSTTLSIELEAEKTKELSTVVNNVYNIGTHETLTIALATLIKDLTNQFDITIELEGHGREEMDSKLNVTRTIGWFTSLYPLNLKVQDEDLDVNIKSLKEQIRKVPNKGFDFGIFKYLKDEFNDQARSYVRFNYLGNYESSMKQQSFQLANVGYEFDTAQDNKLTTLLDINAMTIDGKLIITLTYSRHKFKKATIENFLNKYIERINEIITLCSLETHQKFTPSDFSASDISQDDLDSLLA